jgi:hypothetical protein
MEWSCGLGWGEARWQPVKNNGAKAMAIIRGNKTQGHLLNEESNMLADLQRYTRGASLTMLTYQYVFKPAPPNKKNDEDHIYRQYVRVWIEEMDRGIMHMTTTTMTERQVVEEECSRASSGVVASGMVEMSLGPPLLHLFY